MMLNVNRNPKAYSRNGEKGVCYVVGEEYLSLHCHHQNDSCIRWAAMRAILMFHCEDKVTRLSTNHSLSEEKGEPKRNRAAALLLCLTARPNRLSLSGSLSPKLVKAG